MSMQMRRSVWQRRRPISLVKNGLTASSVRSSPTHSRTRPLAQSIDPHQHMLVGLFHLGDGVGLQAQLFSDKRFDEHHDPLPLKVEKQEPPKRLDVSGF